MSFNLALTQAAGVTMGVIGTAMMFRALDKGTRINPNKRGVVFDKLSRFQGEHPIIA